MTMKLHIFTIKEFQSRLKLFVVYQCSAWKIVVRHIVDNMGDFSYSDNPDE